MTNGGMSGEVRLNRFGECELVLKSRKKRRERAPSEEGG